MQSTGNRNNLRQSRTVASGGNANVTIERETRFTRRGLLFSVLVCQVLTLVYCLTVRQCLKVERIEESRRLEQVLEKRMDQVVERAIDELVLKLK
jgi:hypothetical protein